MRARALAFILVGALPLLAWGRKGHEAVAAGMLRSLPAGPAAWLRPQEEVLRAHCTDPDHWRHDRKEPPRHFLNVEPYGGPDGVPFEVEEALRKVGPDTFQRAGQVPWIIQDRFRDLVDAFKGGKPGDVALVAAILSHYVADLHVPLHTTENHNGQDTGQRGIHSRWESGLVERFLLSEDLHPPPAALEKDLFRAPWRWLKASYAQVPDVLSADRASDLGTPQDRRGAPQRTPAYWALLWAREGDRVKSQLEAASLHTAQLVLYAWVLAGRPPAP